MPNPATVREQRLRKTKAQLIDEIDTLEQRAAAKEAQLRVALDNMPGGMTVEDRDRNYVLFNSKYSELHDYPEGFLKVGMSAREEVRFQAERGDFGPGDKDELVEKTVIYYFPEYL
jgi:PAS domain-containing protein